MTKKCDHTPLFMESFRGPKRLEPCIFCEREQLRGNLSLAEEGLASAMQESQAAAEVSARVIERLQKREAELLGIIDSRDKALGFVDIPSEPNEGQSVRIPTTEREAELMAKLGMQWLEEYAPHRLKSAPEPVSAPSAWMNAAGLVSSAPGGGYDIPLYPGAPEPKSSQCEWCGPGQCFCPNGPRTAEKSGTQSVCTVCADEAERKGIPEVCIHAPGPCPYDEPNLGLPVKSGGNAVALVTIGHTQDETGYCLICESRPCRQA